MLILSEILGIWVACGLPAPLINHFKGRKTDPRYALWLLLEVIILGPIATILAIL